MAFTAANLASVEAAIVTVGAGGVAEIEDAFGNRTKYSSITELLKLKAIMEKDVAKTARTSSFDLVKFASKS